MKKKEKIKITEMKKLEQKMLNKRIKGGDKEVI